LLRDTICQLEENQQLGNNINDKFQQNNLDMGEILFKKVSPAKQKVMISLLNKHLSKLDSEVCYVAYIKTKLLDFFLLYNDKEKIIT